MFFCNKKNSLSAAYPAHSLVVIKTFFLQNDMQKKPTKKNVLSLANFPCHNSINLCLKVTIYNKFHRAY